MANRVHASTSRRRDRRRPRTSRARPVPAAANAAIEPTAPSDANIGWRRIIAIAIDPKRLTTAPVTPHPPTTDSVGGDGGMIGATGSPALSRRPRRTGRRQGSPAEPPVATASAAGRSATSRRLAPSSTVTWCGTAVGPSTGPSPTMIGTLPASWRIVTAPSAPTSSTAWCGSTCGSVRRTAAPGGPADEVPSWTEADRAPDCGSGDLDDGHERLLWRRVDATHPADPVDAAPGSQMGPGERRCRVDLDAVDRHAGRRVDAERAREFADGCGVGVGPQLGGQTVGSGDHEARWTTEMHDDLWVGRPPLRKASSTRRIGPRGSGELVL